MPIRIMAPPTSIAPVRKYLFALGSEMIPYYGVITEISLTKKQSGQGIEYSQLMLKAIAPLDEPTQAKFNIYREGLVPRIQESLVNAPIPRPEEMRDAEDEDDESVGAID